MKAKDIIRHIFGYIIGGALFALVIPYGIYNLSIKTIYIIPISFPENNYIALIISGLLFIIGIIFILWSNLYLFAIGKGGPADVVGITISPRTKHLVIAGPYRYTRNPMVFGALSCYFAIAIFLNSIITLGVLVLFVFIIIIYLKNTEEKRLLNDFGEEYIQYKKKVSMIFPWPKRLK
ncbi:MAG: isoprenylcysteine carboxylmethyltransferase family protein [Spirochaetes bacterium]|nr:isoprenylcysteine carboxylmethyltransferase family protein [Spirochaetota bacterium]